MDALASLVERLPDGAVSTHPGELSSRSRDHWPLAMLREARGERLPRPLAVVFPRATEDVATTLAWATETGTPVVPRGAGSGVCGGAQAVWRGIVLDLSRMNRVLDVDETSRAVTVEAGIRGDALEGAVAERGLTLGHYPQSMAISSVGGWIAASSAGQASVGYGAVEDILLGATAVLPTGAVLRLVPAPRSAVGPDLRRLLIGSEGTLAVITEATLALSPRPEGMRWVALRPDGFGAALALTRESLGAGDHPMILRAYDEVDASMTFGGISHEGGCVIIAGFSEGAVGGVGAEAFAERARILGADVLPDTYGAHWWDHRNDAVTLFRRVMGEERMLGHGVIVDTLETAGLWGRLPELYTTTRDALLGHASQAVGCHLSHAYRSGASLYFTFLIREEDDAGVERTYLRAWQAAAEASRGAGGTLSHHHGIGLLKTPFVAAELGETGIGILRGLKKMLDPAGVLNPGKLLPEEA